ncbi:MAG: hypothetical protein E6R03_04240 [Hyphomicrobiaceae bacterium]|nr:MAG: hypothetical protein E6R03_04240 [Hyphomicrobiaceae bacterium]
MENFDPKIGSIVPRSSRTYGQVPNVANSDVDFIRSAAAEYATRTYPKLNLRLIDRAATKKHSRYRESTDIVYLEPTQIPIRIEHTPSATKLSKWGIDSPREIVAYFCIPILDALGIRVDTETSLIGSLVEFDGKQFRLQSQHRTNDSYWAQSNEAFFIACTADKYQHEMKQA